MKLITIWYNERTNTWGMELHSPMQGWKDIIITKEIALDMLERIDHEKLPKLHSTTIYNIENKEK